MARSKGSKENKKKEEVTVLMVVKEAANPVRVRSGAGINFPQILGRYLGPGEHEVVDISAGDGSKTGWIALDYVTIIS